MRSADDDGTDDADDAHLMHLLRARRPKKAHRAISPRIIIQISSALEVVVRGFGVYCCWTRGVSKQADN